jgi:thiamine transporter
VTGNRTRTLVEIALTIALSAVLGVALRAFRMPAGGSISLEMLPIVVLALRRGTLPAVIAGALYGLVNYSLDPFFVHWAQVVLDYPVAHGLVGLAGVVRPLWRAGVDRGRAPGAGWFAALPAALIGSAFRLSAAWVSGWVFFATNAPAGQPAWLYSLAYNVAYLAPSAVACGVCAAIVLPAIERAVPVR